MFEVACGSSHFKYCMSHVWCDMWHVTDQTQPPKSWLSGGRVWPTKHDPNKPLDMWLTKHNHPRAGSLVVVFGQPNMTQTSHLTCDWPNTTTQELALGWSCLANQTWPKQATWHVTDQTQPSKSWLSGGRVWPTKHDPNKPLQMFGPCLVWSVTYHRLNTAFVCSANEQMPHTHPATLPQHHQAHSAALCLFPPGQNWNLSWAYLINRDVFCQITSPLVY
jgi:hypothetical protein